MAGGRTRSNTDAGSDVTKMDQGDVNHDDANSAVSATILAVIKAPSMT